MSSSSRSSSWLLKPKNPFALRFDAEFFKVAPDAPGVYLMRDEKAEIIYVGKAKSLRDRLKSYRYAVLDPNVSRKTVRHLDRVRTIEWEVVVDEKTALKRECELIHRYRPKFNVALMFPELHLYVELVRNQEKIQFRLSREFKSLDLSNDVFGAFRGRKRLRRACMALQRLDWLAHSPDVFSQRFLCFPGRLSEDLVMDEQWIEWSPFFKSSNFPKGFSSLCRFFRGTSSKFLDEICKTLDQRLSESPFWKAVAAKEIESVEDFYRFGPARLKKLKKNLGRKSAIFSQQEIDKLLTILD